MTKYKDLAIYINIFDFRISLLKNHYLLLLLLYNTLIYSLCCTFSPMTHLFVPGSLYFLFFLTYFTHPSNTLSSDDCLFVLYIYVSGFFVVVVVVVVIFLHFFLIFHISLKSIIQYSHFIISLHIKSSESIHFVPNGKMLFLSWVNNIHIYIYICGIYIQHLFSLFI